MFNRMTKKSGFSRARERQAVVCVSATRCLRQQESMQRMTWLVYVLAMAICLMGCRGNGSAVVIQSDLSAAEIMGAESQSEETVGSLEDTEVWDTAATSASVIYVHICGQVCVPGVYALPEGSRVWDAVEAAGGLTEAAQADAVNLALMVADGSKVTIPSQAETEEADFRWYVTGSGAVSSSDGGSAGGLSDSGIGAGQSHGKDTAGRVDLNRADVTALMTIPGIGQVRAEAIVAYRETQGPFGAVEDIMKVAGIKEGLFAKIKDYITVGG